MKKQSSLLLVSALAFVGCSSAPEEASVTSAEELQPVGGATYTERLSCSSQLFQRRVCNVDTNGGRIVRAVILQDMSTPPFACQQRNATGYGDDHVWVDRGCSAEFEVTIEVPVPREQIQCESIGRMYRECGTSIRDVRRVRLLRQDSSSPCEEGRSFGALRDAIWVDRGCRGLFEVIGRRGGGGGEFAVELFDRGGFQGNRFVVRSEAFDLRDTGFDNRTESLIVRGGRWEICEHPGFSGWCRTFDPGRYDDLGPLAGEISSVRPR